MRDSEGTPGDQVSVVQAAQYLETYVRAYRAEYGRFVSSAPRGGGYPRLAISPYLDAGDLTCYLAIDGAAVVAVSQDPYPDWHIAGGPALLVDQEPTRTPKWVTNKLEAQGLLGKPIGIYRIVAHDPIPEDVWAGTLPAPEEETLRTIDDLKVTVELVPTSLAQLIERLTFGAFGRILDLRLPSVHSAFWSPLIIRHLGSATADRNNRRFFHYMEILRHVELAAWETRTIPVRVNRDVRRDFAWAAASAAQAGGTIAFDTATGIPVTPPLPDRLEALAEAIQTMESLLAEPDQPEAVFQRFLEGNSVLLDVYAEAIPKPRFEYPAGASPSGKAYVEPDFLLRYPGHTYKLVELERPEHVLATQGGQQRAEVSHAVFQIAEWRDFIGHHYEVLKEAFPDITSDCPGLVIISRDTENRFESPEELARYLGILRTQYHALEVVTYDGLLTRARVALAQLSALAT